MIDHLLKDDEAYPKLLLNIGLLTLNADTKEYLKSNLQLNYDNRKKAEDDVIRYSLKVIISTFIYVVLISTSIESFTIGFISIKDLELIKIFFPIIILYYSFLMSSVDLFRIQSLFIHYNIQGILYPEITLKKLEDLFIPFSLINLISDSPSSNKVIRSITNLASFILFSFVALIGFFVLIYSIKYGMKKLLFTNMLFCVSLFIQASLILLTISVFIRKKRLAKV